MYSKLRKKVYVILEPTVHGGIADKIFEYFIMLLVILNIAAAAIETENSVFGRFEAQFRAFEFFSVIIFTAEYLLRIWTCVEDKRFNRPVLGRIKFMFTPMALVDLLAILPFYFYAYQLASVSIKDGRIMRIFRLFRLLRLFKLGRYSDSLQTFGRVFKAKKEELIIVVFVVLIALFLSSSLMYFAENGAQPDKFSSIPAAMWWGVATLTTVGYGDVFPITVLGKFIGSIIAILGIGFFALPAGILASAFAEEIKKEKKSSEVCPHCGKSLKE